MIDAKATSTDTRNFTLTISEKEIGRLIYKKWFSFDAKVELADLTTYQIGSKGFLGTTIEMKKEENVLLSFKMNWKGNIIINTYFEGERAFTFKRKGFWKSHYILLDNEGNQILTAHPDFKWSAFNYDYAIQLEEIFKNKTHNELLVFAIVHCANYYVSMTTTS